MEILDANRKNAINIRCTKCTLKSKQFYRIRIYLQLIANANTDRGIK